MTDSPLLLSILYNRCGMLGSNFYKVVSEVAKSFDSLSYFLPVIKHASYDSTGRIHDECESSKLSDEVLRLLAMQNVEYKVLGHDENSMMSIVDDVMNALGKNSN